MEKSVKKKITDPLLVFVLGIGVFGIGMLLQSVLEDMAEIRFGDTVVVTHGFHSGRKGTVAKRIEVAFRNPRYFVDFGDGRTYSGSEAFQASDLKVIDREVDEFANLTPDLPRYWNAKAAGQ